MGSAPVHAASELGARCTPDPSLRLKNGFAQDAASKNFTRFARVTIEVRPVGTIVLQTPTYWHSEGLNSCGYVGYDIKGDTWVGPFEPTNTPMAKVQELAGLMTRSGMNTIALPDARGAQWTKLIFNAATNPVGALTLLHHGAATRFAPTGQLFHDLIAEGEAVARKLGIELHGDPRQLVQKGANAPGKHRASMLQDVMAKRQTEVDFMNGAIVHWGEKVGVPTPLNQAVWELIKGLEHSWKDPE